jgi:hypothetical protein
MSIIFLPFLERERERERESERGGRRQSWDGSERHYIGGGVEEIYSVQKVPRLFPLVLLIRVKQMIIIYSKFNFFGLRGAAFERNLIRH